MVDFTSERRRWPRLENNIPIKISSDDFDVVTETKNLSTNGVYCRVDKKLPLMSKLQIHLLLPLKRHNKVMTKRISCQGVVVRSEAMSDHYFNVAIYFTDIQQKDVNYLNDYISSLLKKPKTSASSSPSQNF